MHNVKTSRVILVKLIVKYRILDMRRYSTVDLSCCLARTFAGICYAIKLTIVAIMQLATEWG